MERKRKRTQVTDYLCPLPACVTKPSSLREVPPLTPNLQWSHKSTHSNFCMAHIISLGNQNLSLIYKDWASSHKNLGFWPLLKSGLSSLGLHINTAATHRSSGAAPSGGTLALFLSSSVLPLAPGLPSPSGHTLARGSEGV